MKKSLLIPSRVYWVAFAVLLLISISVAYAAPMPRRTLVNHKTQQCAQITPGDECGDVILPPDWEYQDPSLGEKCPDNYTLVDLRPEWMGFKAPHCCTEGHSGSGGDCQDVVIQQSQRQCAFVEDIQKCSSLPDGWDIWGQNCSIDFKWVEDVVCIGAESSPTVTPTHLEPTETTPAVQLTDTPTATQTEPVGPANVRNPLCPCASLGLVLVALLVVGFRRF